VSVSGKLPVAGGIRAGRQDDLERADVYAKRELQPRVGADAQCAAARGHLQRAQVESQVDRHVDGVEVVAQLHVEGELLGRAVIVGGDDTRIESKVGSYLAGQLLDGAEIWLA